MKPLKINLGPIMLDLETTTISDLELKTLQHPQVGGVILFSRNFDNYQQIKQLCADIHKIRTPHLLIAVDHEGGRVQRFKDGFSLIPAMGKLGEIYENDPQTACQHSHNLAWLMAHELIEVGVDFSFAPILDIETGISEIIGDRSFHHTPKGVTELSQAWISGMRKAGMMATGKHFPGHGSVKEDSHIAIPVDNRDLQTIEQHDLIPFEKIIKTGLEGIMPAHVYYPKIDADMPAGFSKHWLQNILRDQLGFKGVIFSDDLSMTGAQEIGNFSQRAEAALNAGCDMVLVCNNPGGAEEVLSSLNSFEISATSHARLLTMQAQAPSHDLSTEALASLSYLNE